MGAPPLERVTRTYEVKKVADKDGGYVLKVAPAAANPGDTIRWEIAEDHLVSIWFPDSGVFYSPSVAVMHQGPVEAMIRTDAKRGTYEYAIYDHTEHEFVTCASHPKLEIPKP